MYNKNKITYYYFNKFYEKVGKVINKILYL